MLVSHSGHGSAFSAALPCPSYVHSAHTDTHTRHRQRRTHHFTLVSDFIPFPSTLCYSTLSTHESPPPIICRRCHTSVAWALKTFSFSFSFAIFSLNYLLSPHVCFSFSVTALILSVCHRSQNPRLSALKIKALLAWISLQPFICVKLYLCTGWHTALYAYLFLEIWILYGLISMQSSTFVWISAAFVRHWREFDSSRYNATSKPEGWHSVISCECVCKCMWAYLVSLVSPRTAWQFCQCHGSLSVFSATGASPEHLAVPWSITITGHVQRAHMHKFTWANIINNLIEPQANQC